MYWTYLRRELGGRRKQTVIVAAGLAIAIALVVVVTSLTAGVRDAQKATLQSVYGVGTDLTVTGAAQTPGSGGTGGQRFDFRQGAGSSSGGTTTVNQSRLTTEPGRSTLSSATVKKVAAVEGVSGVSSSLSLRNVTFNGQLPTRSGQNGGYGQAGSAPQQGDTSQSQGGPDGAGGSSFNVDSFTVLGIDTTNTTVGPLTSVKVSSGRQLTSADASADVAVVDATYAKSNSLTVGGTIDVGGTKMKIVGIVASSSASADTASNVYIPLAVAQKLAGTGSVVSTIYVTASSAADITAVQKAIETAVPKATVSSQADLAATVSSSLSGAASLITNLGTWLAIVVLLVAVVLAVLFTSSGVARRTREFGTLKAIGWSNRRVVGQVAGESVIQSIIGGLVGLVLGLAAVITINVIAPTVSSGSSPAGAGPGGGPGGGFTRLAQAAASEITLHAPVTVWILAAAVGLAVLAGLIAGAFGGWRAARLSPAEALRAVS
ncbi:membrane protein [Microbacterium mangrovi]|uniref:Membrane protein n=1 Tax=Microbacterium mangrovi TaxID=1348253 RepID=A0A0B2AA39_9MICO|nr:ABC transporter permease [Microbacterium mangrovi]KHK98501.1 membrane protein [Microbacterium mangrovi]